MTNLILVGIILYNMEPTTAATDVLELFAGDVAPPAHQWADPYPNRLAKYEVWHGPMQKLCERFDANLFDAIITDPPYARKHWPLYQYLLDEADRILKPGGYLLMIVPHIMLDPSKQSLTIKDGSTMRFRWPLMMDQQTGNHARLCNAKRNIRCTYKMIGWWIKEPAVRDYSEVVDSFQNDPPKKKFSWEQSPSWAQYCLGMLKPYSFVLDPMAGHGVLPVEAIRMGHRVVACELDKDRADETARRVWQVLGNTPQPTLV